MGAYDMRAWCPLCNPDNWRALDREDMREECPACGGTGYVRVRVTIGAGRVDVDKGAL